MCVCEVGKGVLRLSVLWFRLGFPCLSYRGLSSNRELRKGDGAFCGGFASLVGSARGQDRAQPVTCDSHPSLIRTRGSYFPSLGSSPQAVALLEVGKSEELYKGLWFAKVKIHARYQELVQELGCSVRVEALCGKSPLTTLLAQLLLQGGLCSLVAPAAG